MAGANKILKEKVVNEIKSDLAGVNSAVVSHYSGITVEQITKLRASLRQQNVKFKVLKNKLSIRAIEGTPLEKLKDFFKGPTAIAYSKEDPIALAKALNEFAKTESKFLIQAGVVDGDLLDKGQVIELAKIPSREILLSRLVGSMQNSYAGFVYVLGSIMRKQADASPAESAKEPTESVKEPVESAKEEVKS
jgi:large subunit ribosomal protein L10